MMHGSKYLFSIERNEDDWAQQSQTYNWVEPKDEILADNVADSSLNM